VKIVIFGLVVDAAAALDGENLEALRAVEGVENGVFGEGGIGADVEDARIDRGDIEDSDAAFDDVVWVIAGRALGTQGAGVDDKGLAGVERGGVVGHDVLAGVVIAIGRGGGAGGADEAIPEILELAGGRSGAGAVMVFAFGKEAVVDEFDGGDLGVHFVAGLLGLDGGLGDDGTAGHHLDGNHGDGAENSDSK